MTVPIVAPTLDGSLTELSNSVALRGLTPGAILAVLVNGAAIKTFAITTVIQTFGFGTTPFRRGDLVTATQQVGTETSPASASVTVGAVRTATRGVGPASQVPFLHAPPPRRSSAFRRRAESTPSGKLRRQQSRPLRPVAKEPAGASMRRQCVSDGGLPSDLLARRAAADHRLRAGLDSACDAVRSGLPAGLGYHAGASATRFELYPRRQHRHALHRTCDHRTSARSR